MVLAVSLRVDFVDGKGKASFTKVRVPTGFAIIDYQEFGTIFCQDFLDLSNARITNASICVGIDLTPATLKVTANVLADVAQKAFFNFNTIVGGFFAKMNIPTLDETLVVTGSDDIDQTDLGVAAFVLGVESGIAVTAGVIDITDGRGNPIQNLKAASEKFRRQ